ncbi:DUF1553 domain-containing protein [Bremerella sp. T1]|uniref:DUF1553 domain-containing protein n=1 Tax=Bremerella sp. TYQ1 TaxID=3119568 RepID=UPI001CCA30E5|nr:DUF1553 domain-containing protein [Bremerella volcania]UBM36697.1 DUF1553 domain-containing protein [Bremerella volcania]
MSPLGNAKGRAGRLQHALTISVATLGIVIAVAVQCLSDEIDFNRDVRPILADNCFECHGPDESSREADLRFDLPNDVLQSTISVGSPEESLLLKRLISTDEFEVMPPPDSKRRPTADQIEILRRWTHEGAKFETHWSFVPPKRPEVPAVSDPSWPRNEVDHFVHRHLAAEELTPSADADPHVLARRLSLTLTGLPVLPSEGNQFAVEYARDPDLAISRFVDGKLASSAYGEHLAWRWLDAARYADTNGYQGDGYRIMWPWRDWLVRNLNQNLPFDQMTKQMLAGDLLMPPQTQAWDSADWIEDRHANESLVATGFLRNHRYDTGSATIPEESKFENATDRLETVGTVWMGLTLQCARCHTHKFDPIQNREYYQLLSFFDKVPEVGSALKEASHPYIHAPGDEHREELAKLQAAAAKSERLFSLACQDLGASQASWEATLFRQDTPFVRVKRGLRHRFAESPIQFDGSRSIEKSNDPISLCAGDKHWTISFWFQPEADVDGAIFSSVEEPERYRPGIQADYVEGSIRVRHVCRWLNSYIEFRSTEKLNVGQWYHVTFSCDGRMQGLAYQAALNGSRESMICTHSVTNDSAEKSGKAPLVLGGSPLMDGFQGKLHDLRFYDRLLSKDEIRSLADRRSTSEIAQVPAASRTAAESATMQLAFLESVALPKEVQRLRDNTFASQAKLLEAIRSTPTVMVMKESRTEDTRIRLAGVYDSLGDAVHSGTPAFLPPMPEGTKDRLTLARWLTSPEHPLTARVAVNRIWQHLWGAGLVDSPENFGTQCPKPIHADLLDWLATEYIRSGWDTKALIKLIVTSRTFRQSSYASDQLWVADPENRHLARGPRYRLPVNIVRDQALMLSGRLNSTVGGPPVILDEVRGKDGKPMKVPFEQSNCRKTIYSFWKRNSPHPLLAVFDVADRNQCEVRTLRTNTPLQALVTLNEQGFVASAEAFGKRVRESGDTNAQQLAWAWQACTGRKATVKEIASLQASFSNYLKLTSGDEDLAWTALSNVLLNLDATLNLE